MKSSRRKTSLVPGGGPLFQRMFTRLGCEGRPPRFRVEFYPYSSLVLTIRRREEVVYVRFSDLLQRAPLAALEGAAAHRMEHAELAAAIRLLRSRAESDSAESQDGSLVRSGVRRGICIVARDA